MKAFTKRLFTLRYVFVVGSLVRAKFFDPVSDAGDCDWARLSPIKLLYKFDGDWV